MDQTENVDLDAIEARVSAASTGKWYYTTDGPFVVTADGRMIADLRGLGPERKNENGPFIAHARTDIPALIAEVRRLRAELSHRLNTDEMAISPEAQAALGELI